MCYFCSMQAMKSVVPAVRLLASLVCFNVAIGAAADDELFVPGLERGAHAVGFRSVVQLDRSRSLFSPNDFLDQPREGENARPITIFVWYPASTGDAPRATVRDYAEVEATFGGERADVARSLAGVRGTSGAALIDLPCSARIDAEPLDGPFPVVVYAPGRNGVGFENWVLCEYLASRGFYVLATPARGVRSREMESDSVAAARVQARDLAVVLDWAGRQHQVDTERVALCGYSLGAVAATAIAIQQQDVDALVWLDGTQASRQVRRRAEEWIMGFELERLRIPTLVFDNNADAEYLDEFPHADIYRRCFPDAEHSDFAALQVVFDRLIRFGAEGRSVRDYSNMVRDIGAFLGATFDSEEELARFARDGGAAGETKPGPYSHRAGSRVAPTLAEIVRLIEARGARDALDVVAGALGASGRTVGEPSQWRTLATLGAQAESEGRLEDALALHRLNLKVAPDWFRVHYEVARLSLALGDRTTAQAEFRTTLEHHPWFAPARNALAESGADVAPPPDVTLTETELAAFDGDWVVEGTDDVLRFATEGGRLVYVYPSGRRQVLRAASIDRFLLQAGPGNECLILFQIDEDRAVRYEVVGLNTGRVVDARIRVPGS